MSCRGSFLNNGSALFHSFCITVRCVANIVCLITRLVNTNKSKYCNSNAHRLVNINKSKYCNNNAQRPVNSNKFAKKKGYTLKQQNTLIRQELQEFTKAVNTVAATLMLADNLPASISIAAIVHCYYST